MRLPVRLGALVLGAAVAAVALAGRLGGFWVLTGILQVEFGVTAFY